MVYVGRRRYKLGNMWMSHMVADNLNELHEMARSIGVDRKHFQDKPAKPHYDVCRSRKELAISFGAKLVDDREIIVLLKKNYSIEKNKQTI